MQVVGYLRTLLDPLVEVPRTSSLMLAASSTGIVAVGSRMGARHLERQRREKEEWVEGHGISSPVKKALAFENLSFSFL